MIYVGRQPPRPSGKMPDHVWPHCGPSNARSGPDRLVDILNRRDAFGNQADRLTPKRGLKTIGDVASDFFANADRDFAQRLVDRLGPFNGALGCMFVPHNLN